MKKCLLILVSTLLVGIFSTASLFAQVEKVVLRVDGLSCPFCAYGLEKKINRVAGVTSYDIDMRRGILHADVLEDVPLDLENFRKAVKDAGFTLREISLEVTGTVAKTRAGWVLVLGNNDEQILLYESETITERFHQGVDPKGLAISHDLVERLTQLANEQKVVRIKGPVHEHAGLPLAIAIENLEVR